MTGSTFDPISVFGYTTCNQYDLLYRGYAQYVDDLNNSDKEEDEDCQVDVFHCMKDAYSRWESQAPDGIFWEHYNETNNTSAFAVLGVKITDKNINKVEQIRHFLERLNCVSAELAPIKFSSGILMYTESDKESYGVCDTDSDDCSSDSEVGSSDTSN